MTITTQSGSVYTMTINSKGVYMARREGGKWHPVVGIYPDRLPFLMATVELQPLPDGRVEGFNEHGVRTLVFEPLQLRKDMILANRYGLRSTRIVKIVDPLA